jgi:spermidine synthase
MEVLAARAMAPAVGSGPVAWSALLATALGTLAVGNLLGGRLSRRAAANAILPWALAIAAAGIVLLSQCYAPLLGWAAEQPLVLGELAAAALLQAVPLVMLGILTPVILHGGDRIAGPWAGAVLAAGSGGGIAGALGAGLLLLPGLGLARSFLVLAVLLAAAAIPAVWTGRRWTAAAVLLLIILYAAWRLAEPRQPYPVESLCGQVEVRETGLGRVLLVDGLRQTAFPTDLRPGEALRCGYLLELALAMRPGTKTALVVGLGGGLAPRLLAARGVACQSVEIDPAVIEIARREFAFAGDATQGDGRRVLARRARRYDLIFLDVCTADRLPWHLFTFEAMQLIHQRLTPGGILAIQFIGDDGPWSASLVRTVEAAFGARHSVMAGPQIRRDPVGLRWLFATADGPPQLPADVVPPGLPAHWQQIEPAADGSLLTDDHFPAELAWARAARQWRDICRNR